MAFITLSPGFSAKSFTGVENKFITKYMPVLDPLAVKVYIYGLYVSANGLGSMEIADLAAGLSITEEEAINCFEYLEEFELVNITSRSPFEVCYLEAENVRGTPKRYKSEKYADFAKSVQAVIKGRMISTSEYQEYFYLMEEYGFEQSALLMIVNYCVNLKGDDIRVQYIKKVAKSFAAEGAVTAKKVDEKLSAFTSSTPSLIKLFTAIGINRRPDVDDDRLYKKWLEMGFSDDAVTAAAKFYKTKNTEKLDEALAELYRNKKFDVKEIEYFCNSKNSVRAATLEIAKNLGVYMQNAAPYIENFVNKWYDMGYEADVLKEISSYCFMHEMKSFEAMNEFLDGLYADGIVDGGAVSSHLKKLNAEEQFLKRIISVCGLTRRTIAHDRESLSRWRGWNFSDEMILRAADLSAGKNNPVAYMNGVLSSWKNAGVFTPDGIEAPAKRQAGGSVRGTIDRGVIERHYAELRQLAEYRAEKARAEAEKDAEYHSLKKNIDYLNIKLAFAEARGENTEKIAAEIAADEKKAADRLNILGIDSSQFTPHYNCAICNDTGYDSNGTPCPCMKKFIEDYKNN